MKTINAMWQSFHKAAVPANASVEKYRDMKKSFYAGTAAILHMIRNLDQNMTDEQIGEALNTMHAEIDSYTEQLNRKIN
jgi:hypothetical protein